MKITDTVYIFFAALLMLKVIAIVAPKQSYKQKVHFKNEKNQIQ